MVTLQHFRALYRKQCSEEKAGISAFEIIKFYSMMIRTADQVAQKLILTEKSNENQLQFYLYKLLISFSAVYEALLRTLLVLSDTRNCYFNNPMGLRVFDSHLRWVLGYKVL